MEEKGDHEKSNNRKGKKYVYPFVQFDSNGSGKIEEIRVRERETCFLESLN